jgi:hypothetical protein
MFEHQNVANTMENDRFELQTVEMAVSSSKMQQFARKTDPQKKGGTKKTQNDSRPCAKS